MRSPRARSCSYLPAALSLAVNCAVKRLKPPAGNHTCTVPPSCLIPLRPRAQRPSGSPAGPKEGAQGLLEQLTSPNQTEGTLSTRRSPRRHLLSCERLSVKVGGGQVETREVPSSSSTSREAPAWLRSIPGNADGLCSDQTATLWDRSTQNARTRQLWSQQPLPVSLSCNL